MDDCWKPAEEAAGGEWKADAQGIVSQCPYSWFFESLKASQPEHCSTLAGACHLSQETCANVTSMLSHPKFDKICAALS